MDDPVDFRTLDFVILALFDISSKTEKTLYIFMQLWDVIVFIAFYNANSGDVSSESDNVHYIYYNRPH